MGMTEYIFGVIPTYTFMMFGGVFVCLLVLFFLRTNEHSQIRRVDKMLGAVSAIVFGLIGAKLLFILVSLSAIASWKFIDIVLIGFVFYGGLIGGIAGIAAYCLIRKINVIDFFDIGAILLPLGTAIGRLGCYFVGCCYGAETDSFLGVPHADIHGLAEGSRVLPVQLFEFGYCMIIFVVLIFLSRKERPRGLLTCVYAFLYSVCRFTNEFFRADSDRGFVGALSASQFISIFVFAVSLAGIIFIYLKKHGLPFKNK